MPNLCRILSRVGFHSVYERSIKEAVNLAYQHGFASVQVDVTMPRFFPERYSTKRREQIQCYAEDRNVMLKIHAPGEDFSLQTLHKPIQQVIIKRLKEVIDFSCDLGAKLVTIHPGAVPAFTIPRIGHVPIDMQYYSLHIKALKTAFMELSKYSKGRVLLCVENSPITASTIDVLSGMLKEDLIFLTWDIAKMYRSDGSIITDVENFYLRHLGNVRECHLHDRTKEHGHQIIGEGYVDFKHYLQLLSDHDVEYTIEVRPIENAVKSQEALRNIVCEKV